LTSRWQISAGEITGWLTPLLYAFAVLASAWVLHDARRRLFPRYAVAAWTLFTLLYAHIVLPLYLIARTFKPRPHANEDDPQTTATEETARAALVETDEAALAAVGPPGHTETDAAGLKETGTAGLKETGAAGLKEPGAVELEANGAAGLGETVATGVSAASGETTDDSGEQIASRPKTPRFRRRLKLYAPPLVYAAALLCAGAIYFYRDYHSFDAHLARAASARLLYRRDIAIREYRAALRLADDAHTRKLLAVQLAEDKQTEAALAEFRAAERGGEPDEMIPYRVASALDALGRAGEAADEYRKFLRSGLCTRPSPDAACAEAAARVR
jgi:hypothetical protein